MPYTRVWSTITPDDEDPGALLGQDIRNLRVDIQERMNTMLGRAQNATLPDPVHSVYDAGNSGTSKAIDWNNGLVQSVVMTGNCTFTFTNPSPGMAHVLIMVQDATGGRTASLTGWDFGDGSFVPNTTAARINVVTGLYVSSQYLAGVFVIGGT